MASTAKTWIEPLARAGYSARGLVYLIIGFFAVLAAFGAGQEKNTKGALQTLLDQPFGTVIIWALIVGLIGYVIWRLVQSIFDTDGHGMSAKGLAVRGGLLASAFTYATLALFALSMLGVLSGGNDGNSGGGAPFAETLAKFVGNNWVSLIFALIFAGVAIAHWWKALKQKYEDHFDADEEAMHYIHPVSMMGLIARGVVFAIIAVLFFYRFLNASDQSDHPGLKEALDFIQGLPFGQWLLALMGIGLLAFALYSFIEAYWRRINVEDA